MPSNRLTNISAIEPVFTEMCSGSEAGLYLRLIDSVYLGLQGLTSKVSKLNMLKIKSNMQ